MGTQNLVKVIDPLNIFLFFVAEGILAWLFNLPETLAVTFSILFFVTITLYHPVNGFSYIILATPFFLGAGVRPWFWLTEFHVYFLIVTGFIYIFSLLKRKIFPHKGLLLLILISSLLSLPLDLKELYYEFWVFTPQRIFELWLSGHEWSVINYFREVTDVASGVALFWLAVQVVPTAGRQWPERILFATLLSITTISTIGILYHYDILMKYPENWSYASLSLVGDSEGAPTAFSYNRQYLAQYLLIFLPASIWLVTGRGRGVVERIIGLILTGPVLLCLFLSGQRSVLISIIAIIAVCYLVWRWSVQDDKKPVGSLVGTGVSLLIIALFIAFVSRLGDKLSLDRLTSDLRFPLWDTAISMFSVSPALGVGPGRFHRLFSEFYTGEPSFLIDISSGTAHSYYFQTLAEKGFVGLAIFTVFALTILCGALRSAKILGDSKTDCLATIFGLSVFIWLILGLTNNIAHVRVLGIWFWIASGLVIALGFPCEKILRHTARWNVVIGLVLALLFSWQVHLVQSRPISEKMQPGLYNWESRADGSHVRWTGRRAAFYLQREGNRLIIPLSFPAPGSVGSQTVTIRYGDKSATATLEGPSFKEIIIDAGKENGQVLTIENSTLFNPAKSGLSADNRDLGVLMGETRWE